jgi:hypothetical protein
MISTLFKFKIEVCKKVAVDKCHWTVSHGTLLTIVSGQPYWRGRHSKIEQGELDTNVVKQMSEAAIDV